MLNIMNNEAPLQKATIYYNAPRKINIGDVFYKIKAVDFQHFREPCIVCNDKRELTINGVTFKCPCCGSTKETIRINNFVVQRFRVFKITDKVDSSTWKKSDRHTVSFALYRKNGRGTWFSDYETAKITEYDLLENLNVGVENLKPTCVEKYIFDDYLQAVNGAKELTDQQLQKLDAYNAIHGSEYKAEFKTENDKKSK